MDRVRETLQLKFPEWYAAQRSQEQTDRNVILLDDDPKYREFTVCFPWVLLPDALAELFDEFEKKVPVCFLQINLSRKMPLIFIVSFFFSRMRRSALNFGMACSKFAVPQRTRVDRRVSYARFLIVSS